MQSKSIIKPRKLGGRIRVPGDKSISHRSLMFGALSKGTTRVANLLESGDVLSTKGCLEAMGARIRIERKADGQSETTVEGMGLHGLKAPTVTLDCGNSGTTMRLLMGILAGQTFSAQMTGDDSLRKRPMKRVAAPLRQMGARFDLTRDEVAPLTVHGGNLRAISYELPVASAQIKSAVMLAALFAEGTTTLTGLIHSRDHTERLLPHFGAKVLASETQIQVPQARELIAAPVNVPGDISSAAFWMAAAAMVPGSAIEIVNVSLNPSRVGIIKALERMGAKIEVEITERDPEPIGTLRISSAELRGTRIDEDEVPELVDEIPMIAVLATQAQGRTEIRGAEELRVKESDRIEATAEGLRRMGAKVETLPDGFVIEGPQKLKGAKIESHHDHRIAMAFSIAGLVAEGATEIQGTECIAISYPNFYETMEKLTT